MKILSTNERLMLFETYISTITAAEQRRAQMSNVYMSMIVAVIASLGFFASIDLIFPTIASCMISTLWIGKLRYFKKLASAKWQVALSIENEFDIKPFSDEYATFNNNAASYKVIRLKMIELEELLPRLIQVLSILYIICYVISLLLPHEWHFWVTLV